MTDARSVTGTVQSTENDEKETVVVGKESVGKSELVAGLSGTTPTTGNFRGTTVDVERYESEEFVFVDTPGILLGTDTETTRTAISAVEETETVLLVVRATNIDDDLEDCCSDCTRRTTVSAIGFGSACSYQFPATLAVFAAVEMPQLVLPYLGVLTTTTLVCARLIAPERARTASLATENHAFLQWPTWQSVWREARTVIRSFFPKALPVFAGIVLIASLLDY